MHAVTWKYLDILQSVPYMRMALIVSEQKCKASAALLKSFEKTSCNRQRRKNANRPASESGKIRKEATINTLHAFSMEEKNCCPC